MKNTDMNQIALWANKYQWFSMDYWEECISEAFDDAAITASKDQIGIVASWVEGAHENYGMARGYDCIPNPLKLENDKLRRDLEAERRKEPCPICKGRGYLIDYDPGSGRSSESSCYRCLGERKVVP